jgi:hypothetical protein
MDVVVAIEVPPPQERLLGAFVLRSTLHYAGMPEKFRRGPGPYFSGSIKKPVAKSENPEKFRNRFAAKPFCFLALASAQKLPLRRRFNV